MTDRRRLQDRVCLVAGCCGEMGQAVSTRFAEEGGVVVGVDRLDHEIGEMSIVADLTDERAVEAAYASIVERFGRIDVLYNNAGPIDPEDHSALDMTLETWNRVMASILTATWLRSVFRRHRRRRRPLGPGVAAQVLEGEGAGGDGHRDARDAGRSHGVEPMRSRGSAS